VTPRSATSDFCQNPLPVECHARKETRRRRPRPSRRPAKNGADPRLCAARRAARRSTKKQRYCVSCGARRRDKVVCGPVLRQTRQAPRVQQDPVGPAAGGRCLLSMPSGGVGLRSARERQCTRRSRRVQQAAAGVAARDGIDRGGGAVHQRLNLLGTRSSSNTARLRQAAVDAAKKDANSKGASAWESSTPSSGHPARRRRFASLGRKQTTPMRSSNREGQGQVRRSVVQVKRIQWPGQLVDRRPYATCTRRGFARRPEVLPTELVNQRLRRPARTRTQRDSRRDRVGERPAVQQPRRQGSGD